MQLFFRSLFYKCLRRPTINSINLLGLIVSFSLVMILGLHSYWELNTDRFHAHKDRLFLFVSSPQFIYTPGILKNQIHNGVSGVESSLRVCESWEPPVFQSNSSQPISSDLIFSDKNFFRFFTYNALEGQLSTALNHPNSVVISESLSKKLFGENEAVGQRIKLNNTTELTVTAVIEIPKENTSISFNAISALDTRKLIQQDNDNFTSWNYSNFQTFVRLYPDISSTRVNENIIRLFPKESQEQLAKAELIPLQDLHFTELSSLKPDYLKTGSLKEILILMVTASFVFLIALINYINISSSQWFEKIKNTGIIKIMGAKRKDVFRSVLVESVVFFLAAFVLSVLLTWIILPFIRSFTTIQFSQQALLSKQFLAVCFVVAIVTGCIASIFPAIKLASSKAIYNLQQKVDRKNKRSRSKAILSTFQFCIAIILIAFTLLIAKQIRFGSNKISVNQNQIVGIKLTPQLHQKREVLQKILQDFPITKQISFCQFFPGKNYSSWGDEIIHNNQKTKIYFNTFSADDNFFSITETKLLSGRYYSNTLSSDKNKAIVNETFVKQHNISDPIGLIIKGKYEIIGVIEDFHFKSVDTPIAPLVVRNDNQASYCLVHLHGDSNSSFHKNITELKKKISDISPSFPVEILMYKQAIDNIYESERNFNRIFSSFSLIAIILSCLGIFALSLFMIQTRTKEIGIRKVNGAKTVEVMEMLNKDFLKWVVVAFILACPIAWYIMNKWLENFAYKTELSWWIFALAGIIALGVALLTVSFQAWRAATRNPVESLHYE